MRTFLACFIGLLLTTVFSHAAAPQISPAEAAKLVASGKAVLVDVRELAEWNASGVAAPAVLLPKSDFDGAQKEWKPFLDKVGDRQIILYCRLGRRAGTIAEQLEKKGFKVANAGAFDDWKNAGLPVQPMSER